MMKSQIFCIHFAGGNCYSYDFMRPYMNDFEFIPLELPGRGKRSSEPLITDFHAASKDLFDQICQYDIRENYIVFGHSLGAMLGFQLTLTLEEQGIRPPKFLVVSGNPGPGAERKSKRFILGKEAFKEELQKLGGIPDNFFTLDELFDFFEPIIRADFELVEGKGYPRFSRKITAPIYAMTGDQEEFSSRIDNWKNYTTGPFSSASFEGGHFFIHAYPEQISGILKQCLGEPVRDKMTI